MFYLAVWCPWHLGKEQRVSGSSAVLTWHPWNLRARVPQLSQLGFDSNCQNGQLGILNGLSASFILFMTVQQMNMGAPLWVVPVGSTAMFFMGEKNN